TGANIGSPSGREQYLRIIERTITLFEPRLLNVRVSLLENAEELDRTLRFRIDALLRCDPAPEPVVFDSQLETATGSFAVRGEPG
ncbi:MAG: type VI secretion system baseplate subunit TssE, partial [Planctomycetaceae bacterium]